MPALVAELTPIRAHGKFFHDSAGKWLAQGVTYGPFPPGEDGSTWPTQERAEHDFAEIGGLGFNLLRVYHPPPRWLLDIAAVHGLRVLASVPWPQHAETLRSAAARRKVERELRAAVAERAEHAAMFGWIVASEIAPSVVRWIGEGRVRRFLDRLIDIVHHAHPRALASFASFPSTEYLIPTQADFLTFNVFLERQADYARYLARLHNLADGRPLLIGEFGLDSLRHGEQAQADTLVWQHDETVRSGAAGSVLFSWTDEWFNGGQLVDDWRFGLVRADRQPKLAAQALRPLLRAPHTPMDHAPLPRLPKVSVIVCVYNAAETLLRCLVALGEIRYPGLEIVVVDDGSTDESATIISKWDRIRSLVCPQVTVVHPENLGLSAARNAGARAATGEILAYTDADCEPDPDWVYHLVATLLRNDFAGVGGPNLPPPADSITPAAVAASPGGPTHVLLTDSVAEHVPGCNMAFWRWAFEAVGGFDPIFRRAGDDVDFCWRVQATGGVIGFAPGALVWHHRRFSVAGFLSQQAGYGEAEALLRFKHPIFFTSIGSAKWRGVIYGGPRLSWWFSQPVVYHGAFAQGLFQSLYPAPTSAIGAYLGSIEWCALTVTLTVLSLPFAWLRIVPALMFLASLGVAVSWMAAARIEPAHDTLRARLLVACLAWLQPLSRGRARWQARLFPPTTSVEVRHAGPGGGGALVYWSEEGIGRDALLPGIFRTLAAEGWRFVGDSGWGRWDVLIRGTLWWSIVLATVTDDHGRGKCLTRVRLGSRPTLPTVGVLLVAVFGLASHFLLPHTPGLWVFAAAAVFLLALRVQAFGVRRRLRALVARAAEEAKLPPLK